MEKAQRRARLVAQLRFAVTTQDLRTAMLLRRQLAAERPRPTPLFGVPGRVRRGNTPEAAVFTRCLRGLRSVGQTRGSFGLFSCVSSAARSAVSHGNELSRCS